MDLVGSTMNLKKLSWIFFLWRQNMQQSKHNKMALFPFGLTTGPSCYAFTHAVLPYFMSCSFLLLGVWHHVLLSAFVYS